MEGLAHRLERRESHRLDTDSRLLTERWRPRVFCGQALVLVFNDNISMAISVLL